MMNRRQKSGQISAVLILSIHHSSFIIHHFTPGRGMMSQPEPADRPKTTWPVLDANERRVLGVLVEKAKTTPDSYPMSLNALVAGCNQKSNRERIMDLEDVEV